MYEFTTTVLGLECLVGYSVNGDELTIDYINKDDEELSFENTYVRKKVTRHGVDEYIYESVESIVEGDAWRDYFDNEKGVTPPDAR